MKYCKKLFALLAAALLCMALTLPAGAAAPLVRDECGVFDADTLAGADYKITWKTVTSSRFDSTAFKKAMPELAERFTKSSTSRRFTVA